MLNTVFRLLKKESFLKLVFSYISGVGWGVVGDHDTYHLEFMISFRTTEVSSDVGGIHTDSCCVTSNGSGK